MTGNQLKGCYGIKSEADKGQTLDISKRLGGKKEKEMGKILQSKTL